MKSAQLSSDSSGAPAAAEPAGNSLLLPDNRPDAVLQRQQMEQIQRKAVPAEQGVIVQRKENNTGLPDNLKSGIENLSGIGMDDVRVHYNSNKPAQLNALAYAQGTDIHVASGQEKHLPHEAWHVVQQKQGRVRPTLQMKTGTPVNDDPGLEAEADAMGARAMQMKTTDRTLYRSGASASMGIVQRMVGFEYELDGSVVTSAMKPGERRFLRKQPDTPYVALHKGYVICNYGAFDASVDSTPEGFDLEIRIHPVDHRTMDGKRQLIQAVTGIRLLLQKLSSKPQPIRASLIAGDEHVLLSGDFTSGSLQATSGLSLSALHAFLAGDMGKVHEVRMNRLKRMPGGLSDDDPIRAKALFTRSYGQGSSKLLQLAHQTIAMMFPQLNEREKNELAAVVASIATIPVTARVNPLPYAKSATTLLARSDYATVLNSLPARVHMAIGGGTKWRFLVLYVINGYLHTHDMPQVNPDSPIYPPVSIDNGGARLSLTLGEWITAMMPGPQKIGSAVAATDLLTDKNYPQKRYPNDDYDQLESLGQYGDRTDSGDGDKRLPIFEFRKYLKVPLNYLPEVTEGIWELIHMANRI